MTDNNNSNLNEQSIQEWNNIECNKLKIWFEKIKARIRAHHSASYWNNIINKVFTYTSLLLSVIISTISLNIEDSPVWLLPALTITITLIIVINIFFNFGKYS